MAQQQFDNFKLKVKEWMETHPEEYNRFVEEMNKKDNSGYHRIFQYVYKIAPQYKKIIEKRTNEGIINEDISDIINSFSGSNFGETILYEFETIPQKSIFPAMLSWLYWGNCFESTIERIEEMRKDPRLSYKDKISLAFLSKILVSRSKKAKLRTEPDWEKQRKLMKLVDEKPFIDWEEEDFYGERKKRGRPSFKLTLSEMLSQTVTEKPEDIILRMESYLQTKHSELDIAYMKIALEELSYINYSSVKSFRDALATQFGKMIVGERGVQKSYKRLTDIIEGINKASKDIGQDRENINRLKKILSV